MNTNEYIVYDVQHDQNLKLMNNFGLYKHYVYFL